MSATIIPFITQRSQTSARRLRTLPPCFPVAGGVAITLGEAADLGRDVLDASREMRRELAKMLEELARIQASITKGPGR